MPLMPEILPAANSFRILTNISLKLWKQFNAGSKGKPLITRLNTSHFTQIIELWEASVRASHHFLKPEEISFYKPLVLKYALPEATLFGTTDQNKLTGFIGLRGNKVEMLFIHPDYFGQGLGSELLNFAVKEQKCSLIDVNEENPRAYQFYLKHGFTLLSRDELDDCGKPHPILHLHLCQKGL